MDRATILAVAIAAAVIAGAGTAGAAMALSDPASPAQTEPAETTDANGTITVSAAGSQSIAPDKAVLHLSIEKTDEDPNVARTAVADNVSAVATALSEWGVPEEDVQTTDYRIQQGDSEPTSAGEEKEESVYHARQSMEVHLTDTESVGSVIDAAVEAGATDVDNVRFTLREETRNDLRNDALESAMEQARDQAETLAASAELSVDKPRDITTETRRTPVEHYQTESAAAGSEAATDIDAGPVSVETQVTVTYETKQ